MEFQQQEQQVQTDLQPILENLINKNKSLTETGQQQEVISQEQEAQHILPEHLSREFFFSNKLICYFFILIMSIINS